MKYKNRNGVHYRVPWVVLGILFLGVTACLLLPWRKDRTTAEQQATPTPALADAPTTFSPVDVGGGLTLVGLSEAAGNYPEDGSDEYLSNMLCAVFVNNGSATLQYAEVTVTLNGEEYGFHLSTLPPEQSVRAFEYGKAAAPENVESVLAKASLLSFFEEEPAREEAALAVVFHDGYLTVKNISGDDIDREISVYFKNVQGDSYMGGITYRVRIGPLKAGEELSGYSSHAWENSSELMFVSYGD